MESDKESERPVLPQGLFRNELTCMFYEMSKHRFPSVVSCTFCVIAWVAFSMDASYQNVPVFYMIDRVVFDFAICFPLDGSIIRNRIPMRHCWFSKYWNWIPEWISKNGMKLKIDQIIAFIKKISGTHLTFFLMVNRFNLHSGMMF
ncbi:hypothetical protein LQ764DRAFT_138887 [Zygosaccharomyces rouxii]|nr:hypothetical protein LQ764DRAFT_138887 [Zygosaccharomyces rouxii]